MTLTTTAHPDLVADAPLARFTTIRVGGNADWLAEPGSARAVTAALAWARDAGRTRGDRGQGIQPARRRRGVSRARAFACADASRAISVRGRAPVVRRRRVAAARGAACRVAPGSTGLEFGASIPGTVGGAVAMNAGAYAGELKDVLEWAVLCSAEGRRRVGLDELAVRVPVERGAAVRGGRHGGVPRSGPGDPERSRQPWPSFRRASSRHAAAGRAHVRQRVHQSGRANRPGGCSSPPGARGSRSEAPGSRPSTRTSSKPRPGAPAQTCWR